MKRNDIDKKIFNNEKWRRDLKDVCAEEKN